MKIAIDLTPLQNAHRFRGIGAGLANFINYLPRSAQHEFIFCFEEPNESVVDPLISLDVTGLNFQIVYFPKKSASYDGSRLHSIRVVGKLLRVVNGATRQLGAFYQLQRGDDRLSVIGKVDVFLQFDQQQSLPRGRTKRAVIIYDLIPYILEADYLQGYRTARRRGHSRKGSLNHALHRWMHLKTLKINARRANQLIAISEQTKKDFIKYVGVSAHKISVVPFGISEANETVVTNPKLSHFVETSWGYVERPYSAKQLDTFLFFVGGVDQRRKITDLVTAYNHLKASGHNLKLVLAGDILQGPKNIPVPATRSALEDSSYKEDIIYMGFVDNANREWLYQHALAFVYPSRYEGFGLPVLEAMRYGTPVITYQNSSITEVAKDAVLYADGANDILSHVQQLLTDQTLVQKLSKTGPQQATKFSWGKTAHEIVSTLEKLS